MEQNQTIKEKLHIYRQSEGWFRVKAERQLGGWVTWAVMICKGAALCRDELSVFTECQHPEVMKHCVDDLCDARLLEWFIQAQTIALFSQLDCFVPLLSSCYLSSLMLWILSTFLAHLPVLTWRGSVLQSSNILPNSGFPVTRLMALLSCIPFLIDSSIPAL